MFKKTLGIILLVLMSQAFAAPKEVVDQYVNAFVSDLQGKTQLSSEQENALKPILFNNINAREDIISSYMGQKGMGVKMQIRDALQPINEKMQSEAQTILSPEQFDAFKAVQQKNQESVKSRINQDF